ncbi:class I SAM-dependent DNA methyltransferase [Streptomyces sp. WAC06614]|uniref:class I SAM-dependent DNA methyltransferase n=1 Tax=Streptomyces sp. WAC06614 TaxID=2487416 RepID=UPI002696C0EC|nr:class I SAM-dependent DNA methyltransferase [Streptomyces sp. WAC06614]
MTKPGALPRMAEAEALVNKLWSYCNVLRDDGVSVTDYVEQLTYLLFLKMAHEQKTRRLNPVDILDGLNAWQILFDAEGRELEEAYTKILLQLAGKGGTLGRIFQKAQNRIQDPAKLKRLIRELIGKENWSGTGVDIKGDAYEALLARGAEDVKSGAGQYFTPRDLIRAIVDCMQPTPDDTIVDPACGTGGFLLSASEYIQSHHDRGLTPEQRERLSAGAIRGNELVDGTARLAAMNLLLHGIGQPNGESLIDVGDALAKPPTRHASLVLANPPFGKKSSIMVFGEDDEIERKDLAYHRLDFWVTTSNKQLNFVQHIYTLLQTGGRAAVVVPDNVLFEGGPGETLRRRLLQQCDVHTLLRLPAGIFYAGGVKANVLFFDKLPPRADGKPQTKTLWVYDFRTNQHFTLKQKRLRREDLDDFVAAYRPGESRELRQPSEQFKPYDVDYLLKRDLVDLRLLASVKDELADNEDDLLEPHVIADEIAQELESALAELMSLADALRPAGLALQDTEQSE